MNLELKMEKLIPFRRHSRRFTDYQLFKAQATAIEVFLDGVGALQILHAAGFIHGDLSQNNVGFNERVKK